MGSTDSRSKPDSTLGVVVRPSIYLEKAIISLYKEPTPKQLSKAGDRTVKYILLCSILGALGCHICGAAEPVILDASAEGWVLPVKNGNYVLFSDTEGGALIKSVDIKGGTPSVVLVDNRAEFRFGLYKHGYIPANDSILFQTGTPDSVTLYTRDITGKHPLQLLTKLPELADGCRRSFGKVSESLSLLPYGEHCDSGSETRSRFYSIDLVTGATRQTSEVVTDNTLEETRTTYDPTGQYLIVEGESKNHYKRDELLLIYSWKTDSPVRIDCRDFIFKGFLENDLFAQCRENSTWVLKRFDLNRPNEPKLVMVLGSDQNGYAPWFDFRVLDLGEKGKRILYSKGQYNPNSYIPERELGCMELDGNNRIRLGQASEGDEFTYDQLGKSADIVIPFKDGVYQVNVLDGSKTYLFSRLHYSSIFSLILQADRIVVIGEPGGASRSFIVDSYLTLADGIYQRTILRQDGYLAGVSIASGNKVAVRYSTADFDKRIVVLVDGKTLVQAPIPNPAIPAAHIVAEQQRIVWVEIPAGSPEGARLMSWAF